jgi:hypothetical protein
MDLTTLARRIIDVSLYMTLATADDAGRPWASPVDFAHEGYAEFLWVSSPQATHSLNYRAVASEHFMLDPDRKPDQRTAVAV